jgi:hypothetical protein
MREHFPSISRRRAAAADTTRPAGLTTDIRASFEGHLAGGLTTRRIEDPRREV